jgi:hypothetical protein
MRLKNFIQPILVRKSYLYLGIPPLINTSIDINIKNLSAVIVASSIFVVISISGINNWIFEFKNVTELVKDSNILNFRNVDSVYFW